MLLYSYHGIGVQNIQLTLISKWVLYQRTLIIVNEMTISYLSLKYMSRGVTEE